MFLLPFLIGLLVFMVKEIKLDLERKECDQVFNNMLVKVTLFKKLTRGPCYIQRNFFLQRGTKGKGGIEEVKWRDIEVC